MLNGLERLLNPEDTMPTTDRNATVDVLRTAALVGICVVNIHFLGLPLDAAWTPPPGPADRTALFLVEALFQAKFFLLFSFLFGWGIEIQTRAARRAGVAFAGRYGRRLAGLAVFGCLHAVLVFTGDILLLYALLGLLIWPKRQASAVGLTRFALWLMVPALVAMVVLAVLLSGDLTSPAGQALGSGLGGGFVEATQARLAEWPGNFLFLLMFQGPMALAAFALGLAAAKVEFFRHGNPCQQRLQRAVPWLLAIGLPLNLLYASAMGGLLPAGNEILGLVAFLAIVPGAPLLSTVYLAGVIRLSQRCSLPDLLVQAGRNSLTAYVLQGVIAGFVFGGYGLGLYGTVGQAGLLPLSVAIAVAAMLVTGLWVRRFGRGPLEALLRRITYGASA